MSSRILKGVVVSDKMEKTLVVSVETAKRHARYGKSYKVNTKYKVHYEGDSVNIGDRVSIIESAPTSKHKHWKIVKE